jgi:hypothetical protein
MEQRYGSFRFASLHQDFRQYQLELQAIGPTLVIMFG